MSKSSQPGPSNFYLFYVLLSRRFYKLVYFDFDFVANLEYLVSPNQSAKSTDVKMFFFFFYLLMTFSSSTFISYSSNALIEESELLSLQEKQL